MNKKEMKAFYDKGVKANLEILFAEYSNKVYKIVPTPFKEPIPFDKDIKFTHSSNHTLT